jgi:hypothetical protein
MKRSICVAGAFFAFALGCVPENFGAGGTLFYNRTVNDLGERTVRAIGTDGANDRLVPIALPSPAQPVVSSDGKKLLVSTGGELSAVMRSQNVYSVDLTSGAILPVTHYADTITVGTTVYTNLNTEPEFETTAYYTTHLPIFKAYNPAGDKVVTMDLSAVTAKPPGGVMLAAIQTPVLEVYPLEAGLPLGDRLFSGAERTSVNQAGDGVDWHPTRNEVVGPFRANIPTTGTLGPGENEGTVIMVFATSGTSPFLRKLTTPTGTSFIDFNTFVIINTVEQDYAPAISRDGKKVAYVRNTLTADSRVDTGIHLTKCSIRVVNYDGTGDQEIASFQNQLWVTKLAWAPDDSAIAFDIAPRLVVNGLELQMGDAARSEIRVMRLSDHATTLVIPAPAQFPTWSPLANASVQAPQMKISHGNKIQFELTSLSPGSKFDLETSTDLNQWSVHQSFTATTNSQNVAIDPLAQTKARFFRVHVK